MGHKSFTIAAPINNQSQQRKLQQHSQHHVRVGAVYMTNLGAYAEQQPKEFYNMHVVSQLYTHATHAEHNRTTDRLPNLHMSVRGTGVRHIFP